MTSWIFYGQTFLQAINLLLVYNKISISKTAWKFTKFVYKAIVSQLWNFFIFLFLLRLLWVCQHRKPQKSILWNNLWHLPLYIFKAVHLFPFLRRSLVSSCFNLNTKFVAKVKLPLFFARNPIVPFEFKKNWTPY